MYKVRVILDTKEDVIRTFTTSENQNLEQLHFTIAKFFDFNGQEMASFYRTDNEWNQGEEIPLFDITDNNDGISMASCSLKESLPNVGDKLIYVYDFLKMWTFYVEVIEIDNQLVSESKIVLSVGETPEEAPEKEFKADKTSNDLEDDFDNFNDFERLDDFDFDNY